MKQKSLIVMMLCAACCFCGTLRAAPDKAEAKDETPFANMQDVCNFIKSAKVYYLATEENGQPRVRPFGTIHIFEGKLYIQTGKRKNVSKQIAVNPKVELCAFNGGKWVRLSGTLVNDDRREAKVSMLDAYPTLKKLYQPDDGNTQVLYFKDATACLYLNPFTAPRVVKF